MGAVRARRMQVRILPVVFLPIGGKQCLIPFLHHQAAVLPALNHQQKVAGPPKGHIILLAIGTAAFFRNINGNVKGILFLAEVFFPY